MDCWLGCTVPTPHARSRQPMRWPPGLAANTFAQPTAPGAYQTCVKKGLRFPVLRYQLLPHSPKQSCLATASVLTGATHTAPHLQSLLSKVADFLHLTNHKHWKFVPLHTSRHAIRRLSSVLEPVWLFSSFYINKFYINKRFLTSLCEAIWPNLHNPVVSNLRNHSLHLIKSISFSAVGSPPEPTST